MTHEDLDRPTRHRAAFTLTVWIGEPQAHGAAGGSPDDATGTASAAAGYHVCLDHLEILLDQGTTGGVVP